jgi:hypothetical protein
MKNKLKLLLGLALVLSGGLLGCATNKAVKPVAMQKELNWPAVAAGEWMWTPPIVSERFTRASTNALGSEGDIAEINKSIATDNPRQQLRVTDLRWLSSTLTMARVRGIGTVFFYVVEKKGGRWTVLVHYTYRLYD